MSERARELRKAAHQAEVDAILALCHHDEGSFHDDCAACQFRREVAIEHMQRMASVTMWCLSGVHTDCACNEMEPKP